MRLPFFLFAGLMVAASGGAVPAAEPHAVLRREGAFGFPQSKAQVLCDEPELRVSSWNDASHLYVQSILWGDGDVALGETADGRPIGDGAVLCLDVDADGKATPQKDRDYDLNPWPSMPGLRYQVVLSDHSWTGLQGDSKGRGAVRYTDGGDGKRVRVDSFVIPLSEIGKKAGETLRLAYWGNSPHPEMTVNSVGYRYQGRYYSFQIPRDRYRTITLADRLPALDLSRVPDGKDDPCPLPRKETKPTPAVGSVPPEIGAEDWLNGDGVLRLEGLRGKVVLIEFWATWCGPCLKNIPHLNALHDAYSPKGLRVVSLTDQTRKGVEPFLKQTPIKGVVGVGSGSASDYGVTSIPHTFLIGKDGKLLWEGNPSEDGLEKRVEDALSRE